MSHEELPNESYSVENEEIKIARMMSGNYSLGEVGAAVRKLAQKPKSVLSDAWYKILENRSAGNLTSYEWKVLKPLIPYLPHSFLQKVNFSNDQILEFFGGLELHQTQLSLLAETYSSKWGQELYESRDRLKKIGNAFCGLSRKDLRRIRTPVLKLLLNEEFFKSVKGCSLDNLQYLSRRIQSYTVVGPPRTWQPKTIEMLGTILAGLNEKQIRKIPSGSCSRITPDCIKVIPEDLLRKMRTKQLCELSRPSLLAWRRKTMDFRLLNSGSRIHLTALFVVCVFTWT